MSNFNKIIKLCNGILTEGLNKKEYNNIIKNVKIGVEIEVVNDDVISYEDDYPNPDYDVEAIFNIKDSVEPFNKLILEYQKLVEDFKFKKANEIIGIEAPELKEIPEKIDATLGTLVEEVTKLMYVSIDLAKDFSLDLYNKIGSLGKKEDNEIMNWYYDFKESANDLASKRFDIIRNIESYVENVEDEYRQDYNGDSYVSFEQLEEIAQEAVEEYLIYMDRSEGAIDSWSMVEDGSLGKNGIEIVTSAVNYNTFIENVPQICKELSKVGFYGDGRCGYHIGLSSDEINIHELIDDAYAKYQEMGFNKLTSLMVATQQGYKSVFRWNSGSRDESATYSESIWHKIVSRSGKFDLQSILYAKDYDREVQDLYSNPPKYSNTNLGKDNYIELRTLGGKNGWEILKDESSLKKFLYDAISQVFGAVKPLEKKDVIRIMHQQIKKLDTSVGSDTLIQDKNIPSLKLIGKKILETVGDKVVKYEVQIGDTKKLDTIKVLGEQHKVVLQLRNLDNARTIVVKLFNTGHNQLRFVNSYEREDKIDAKKILDLIMPELKKEMEEYEPNPFYKEEF